MNKQDLVAATAEASGHTQKDTAAILDALLATIQSTVASGDKVTLVGFGTFQVTHRKARDGRNPGTGETITIPAKTVPSFKPGKEFKNAIAQSF